MEFENNYQVIDTPLYERANEHKVMNIALLTKEHVLFIGAPGTAKSMLVDIFFGKIGGKLFKTKVTKIDTEDVFFGLPDIEKLKRGDIYYNCNNSILDSHFAFIDEIFDGSDVLLRALLGVLNEREFDKGNFHKKTPLMTAVATANYTRASEQMEAVMDRFLLRWHTKPLDKSNMIFMFDFVPPSYIEKMYSIEEIVQHQNQIKYVKFPQDTRDVFIDLCNEQNFSARRVFKAIEALKAAAYIDHSNEVKIRHLTTMKYMLPTGNIDMSEQIEEVAKRLAREAIEKEEFRKLNDIKRDYDSFINQSSSTLLCSSEGLRGQVELIERIQRLELINSSSVETRRDIVSNMRDNYNSNIASFLAGKNLRLKM